MATKIKVLGTPLLQVINDESIRLKKNRTLDPRVADELVDPTGIHLVIFSMVHNDKEIRTQLMLKMKGSDEPRRGWLDMSFERFRDLPEVEVPIGDGELNGG